jgi:large subunit ribosomal protein L9
VARGYFRNYLYPRGIAQKQDAKVTTMMKKAADAKAAEMEASMSKAMDAKEKIEAAGTLVFEKKVREGSNKIYGSLTQTDVAEALVLKTAVPVRITSVVIPKVTELGKYTGSVELGNDVTAFFEISGRRGHGRCRGDRGRGRGRGARL